MMSLIELCFKVKKIVYRDADSRYSIIKGIITKHNCKEGLTKELTIKGHFPVLYVGDEYSGLASYNLDDNYGYYLNLKGIPKVIIPENKKSLAEFISKRVKGLSLKKAIEIVDLLGIQALTKIRNNYKVLLDVDGIKDPKAQKIYNQLIVHEAFEELAMFIQGMGIQASVANKIYEKYQDSSLSRVRSNPYCICYDNEIAFKYADKIAYGLKIAKNNKHRVTTAVLEYLTNRVNSYGDICVYKDMILNDLNPFLDRYGVYTNNDITPKEVEEAIDTLISKNIITIERDKEGNLCVYKSLYNYIENKIVTNLDNILTEFKNPFCRSSDIDDFINYYESNYYELDIKQKEAVYNSIQNGISILTGGPGTGKTATTNAIVQCIKYVKPQATILLLAPTGKASDRLTELTNMPSSTIHRGINLNPYNEDGELDEIIEDFVFIDESSMVDAYMFEKLTSTISSNTRVVFVGDVDQLPSVGAGLILRDMIDSGKIPTTRLTKIFRQAETSKIVSNAHKIIKGYDTHAINGVDITNAVDSNFIFWNENNPIKVREKLLLGLDRLFDKYKYKINDICVLTPMRLGDLGVNELNRILQNKLNPPSPTKAEYEIDALHCFRVGDRVMQNKNNYDLNVFNGFVGNITAIYTELSSSGIMEYKIEVEYPKKDDPVVYGEKEIEELELAFAMTIHKSQGSEFPVVIMPIHDTQRNMLNRNLVYTGVTRAKEMLIMIGQEEALNYSINHTEIFNRISRLKEKIMDIAV